MEDKEDKDEVRQKYKGDGGTQIGKNHGTINIHHGNDPPQSLSQLIFTKQNGLYLQITIAVGFFLALALSLYKVLIITTLCLQIALLFWQFVQFIRGVCNKSLSSVSWSMVLINIYTLMMIFIALEAINEYWEHFHVFEYLSTHLSQSWPDYSKGILAFITFFFYRFLFIPILFITENNALIPSFIGVSCLLIVSVMVLGNALNLLQPIVKSFIPTLPLRSIKDILLLHLAAIFMFLCLSLIGLMTYPFSMSGMHT